jgi:hypothetical protein
MSDHFQRNKLSNKSPRNGDHKERLFEIADELLAD